MSANGVQTSVSDFWEREILPPLMELVRIPCQSPLFDPDWAAHGHMQQAVELLTAWLRRQLPGAALQVLREGARTPVILVDVPASPPGAGSGTVLMYGHLDKQPPFEGWKDGLGPWQPVLDGQGRLYGRGAADDGYAAFAAVACLQALSAHHLPHARVVLLIECSEESGSPDLPHYLAAHGARMGQPSLVIGLDSGCGNYDQLWSTTSLRGLVTGTLGVQVLREGVHSGIAGGIAPTPFQVLRALLNRLEDPETGRILLPELQAPIPPQRLAQAQKAAQVLGGAVAGDLPWVHGVRPLSDQVLELVLNNSWRASLAIVGQDGMPGVAQAGNVLLPGQTVKFSLRVPPSIPGARAVAAVQQALKRDPPFGAQVTLTCGASPGWDAPPLAPWLERATEAASREFYGREACYAGLGGSIPFMHMIGEKFPRAQFLITGVLGPHSNAHGPNEFLHVPYAKQLTACLVRIVAEHAREAA